MLDDLGARLLDGLHQDDDQRVEAMRYERDSDAGIMGTVGRAGGKDKTGREWTGEIRGRGCRLILDGRRLRARRADEVHRVTVWEHGPS